MLRNHDSGQGLIVVKCFLQVILLIRTCNDVKCPVIRNQLNQALDRLRVVMVHNDRGDLLKRQVNELSAHEQTQDGGCQKKNQHGNRYVPFFHRRCQAPCPFHPFSHIPSHHFPKST